MALVTYWWDQRDGGALLDPRKARLADGISKAAAISICYLSWKSDAITDAALKKSSTATSRHRTLMIGSSDYSHSQQRLELSESSSTGPDQSTACKRSTLNRFVAHFGQPRIVSVLKK